jgi:hypothetical protein
MLKQRRHQRSAAVQVFDSFEERNDVEVAFEDEFPRVPLTPNPSPRGGEGRHVVPLSLPGRGVRGEGVVTRV